jgi:hypothetical protein
MVSETITTTRLFSLPEGCEPHAYVGHWTGERTYVMVNGRSGPESRGLIARKPVDEVHELLMGETSLRPLVSASPDGQHVAWVGVIDGRPRPVLDHRVGPPVDDVLDWEIGPDGVARWWARAGRDIVLVIRTA